MKREFYFQDDKSNKFWTIELLGNAYVVTYGRIGSAERKMRNEFENEEIAEREVENQIASKLKKGYVEGAIASAPEWVKPHWDSMKMSEDVFWRIIRLFDWKKLGDDDGVIEPAIAALSQMSAGMINEFEDILAEKLHSLDTEAHAREVGEYAYGTDEYFSVDLFLYMRCVVVANGPEVYASVLADPTQMPEDCDFEPLLSVARLAYERKTGAEFKHLPPVCYETYSNRKGWKRIT
jgi:predicted DNA-binding WGR domain protein